MFIRTLQFKGLWLAMVALLLVSTAKAQCPTGYEKAPSSSSLMVNGDFSVQAGTTPSPGILTTTPAVTPGPLFGPLSFYSQAGRRTNGLYAPANNGGPSQPGFDNTFSLQTGNITPGSWFGIDNANAFPGDPANNVAAVPTWFYSNGNYFANQEYVLWGQQVTGLVVGKSYTFYAYVNNIIEPPGNAPDDPRIRLRIGGNPGLPDGNQVAPQLPTPYIELSEVLCATTQPLGGWIRIEHTFVATATTEVFKVTSAASGVGGDDFGLTSIGLVECRPLVTASSNSPVCQGATLTLTASTPASGTMTYAWSGPNGYNATGASATRAGMTVADYGVYTVTITDALGATNTATVTVSEQTVGCCTAPTINAPTVTQPTCLLTTGTIVVNATGTGTLEYSVNGAAGPFQLSNTFSLLAAGSYNIRVRLQASPTCLSDYASNPVVLNAATAPTISSTNNNPTVCAGTDGSIVINGLAASTAYTLNYEDDGTPVSTSITSTAGGSYTITGLNAGAYTNINVTIGTCTSNSLTVSLSDPSSPVISSINSSDPTTCSGTDGSFTLNGLTASTSYTVQYNNGATPVSTTLSSNASGALVVSGLSAGSYTNIRVTLAGCTSNTVSTSLIDPATPAIGSITPTNPSACGLSDGSFLLTGLAATTAYTVAYNDGATPISVNLSSNAAGEITVSGLNAGSYTNITVSVAGCISNAVSTVLTEICGPVATDDTDATNEDINVSTNVLTNDTPGAEPLNPASLTILTPPTNGTATISGPGVVTYDPDPNFNGSDTYEYIICDNALPIPLCDTALVTITINPVNDAPTIVDNSATTNEDTDVTFSITGNDTDVDGSIDPSTIDLDPSAPGQQTTFTIIGQGTFTANTTTGEVTFDPATNFNGPVNTTPYTVCDNGTPLPAQCGQANINVTVTPINDAPVAGDDAATTNEDTDVTFSLSGNDTDVDGNIVLGSIDIDPATAGQQTTFTVVGQGTFTVNTTTGEVTFDPVTNFNGPVTTVTYTICDDGTPLPAQCDQANINVTVTPVNDAPSIVDNSATTNEDTDVTFSITGNDSDVDGSIDPSTIDLDPSTPGQQTTFTITGQGTFTANTTTGEVTFDPATNFNGPVNTTPYTVCDNGTPLPAQCGQANINVTVTPINDAPVAGDDVATTDEDTPVTFSLTGNDTDIDGNIVPGSIDLDPATPGQQTSFTIPGQGTFTVNTTTGEVTFTPVPNFNGPVNTVPYSVCDDGSPLPALCDQANINVTVTPINDAPIAINDDNNTFVDTPIDGVVPTNDFDIENDVLTVTTTPVTYPTNGTVSINPDGSYTYIPNPGFEGEDVFTYEICDNGTPSLCDTAQVTIIVSPLPVAGQNNPPVANDDDNLTFVDQPVDGTLANNDSDPDGDPLTYTTTPVTPPSNGTVTINPDGTYTYTPDSGFEGQDQFVYEVCDNGTPALCTEATVFIDVVPTTPANYPPFAGDDFAFTPEDTPVSGDLSPNDNDPNGDGLVYTATPVDGPSNGTVTINTDGTFTYTPNPNYNGPDQFTYEVCDNGSPVECTQATAYILVSPVNDAPIAVNDDNNTFVDVPVSGTVPTNDFDIEGDSLTVTTTPVTDPANGTVVINPDGSYTYTPNPGFVGEDVFTYEICDNGNLVACDTAQVTITVSPLPVDGQNNGPVANDDDNLTFVDQPVDGTLANNDSDPDGDPLTYTTTPVTPPSNGTVTINPDGTYTYTPNPGFEGQDVFVYEVCDTGSPALCTEATAFIDVVPTTPANYPPFAGDDFNTTPEDTPVSGDVLPNDNDPNGDVIAVNTTPIVDPTNGTVVINPDGTYTYTPNSNYNGPDQFTYEICDNGMPVECAQATVYILVNPVNDPPVAVNDDNNTFVDVPVNGTVPTNDFDIEGNTLAVTSTPVVDPANGTVVINPDGSYTYTPDAGFTGVDVFTYEICDNGNPVECDTAQVTITVSPLPVDGQNDGPIANDDDNLTFVDQPVDGTLANNDSDPDGDPLTYNTTPVVDPTNGTVVINPDGTYTYTPNPGFVGQDTFTYEVCDNGTPALCTTADVFIDVVPTTPANFPPFAGDDFATTPEDTPVAGNILPNDNDPNGDSLIVNTTPVVDPTNGTVVINPDGSYTYTPNSNYNGPDQFTYEICDNGTPVECAQATVYILVVPVNDPPIAINDDNNTFVDVPVAGTLPINDLDIEGNGITVNTTPVVQPLNGTVVINPDGTYIYTPNPATSGVDQFSYVICDNGNPVLCDTAQVTITITPEPVFGQNDAPIANDDDNLTFVDQPVSGTMANNDSDPDGDDLVYTTTPVNNPSNGTVVINPDGTYTYTPNPGFVGQDTFTYEVCDNGSPVLCTTAEVFIDVVPTTPGNYPPFAGDDFNTTPEDTPVSGNILPNDNDPNGDSLIVNTTPITQPLNGTVVINPDGTYTYTPNSNYNGPDQFTYEICDNGTPVECALATVYILVVPVNDAPIAINDDNNTFVNTPISGAVMPNDLDIEGHGLLVNTTPVETPSNGSVTLNANGTYTYTPNAGFVGVDTFSYSVCDAGNPTACDTALVIIIVSPLPNYGQNNAPIANNDDNLTFVDQPVNGTVLNNDSDPDGDSLFVNPTPVANPSNGTVVLNPDGTYTYTPNPGFVGQDNFTYEVCDNGSPVLCTQAIVYIDVVPTTPNNFPPFAGDDFNTTPEDTPVTGNILPNDNDPNGDSLIVNTTPVFGPANGTVVINPDGSYTYTPNLNYNGPDQFTYEICDNGTPVECAQATVYILVTPVNDPPVAVNDTTTTIENQPVVIIVLNNDFDVDNNMDSTTVDVINGPFNGNVSIDPVTGVITYIPNNNFTDPDSFQYVFCDTGLPVYCDTAWVFIEVMPVPPVANDDSGTTPPDSPIDIVVITNDVYLPGSLDTIFVSNPPLNGTTTVNQNGTITYTPSNLYCGLDSFDYVICNDTECDTATVVITIECELTIFNAFSPNGDGTNETFVVEFIEFFPNNELRIFNRWGNLVYETEGYLNDWDGKWQGNDLPDGTYYYILKSQEFNQTWSGWIQIMR